LLTSPSPTNPMSDTSLKVSVIVGSNKCENGSYGLMPVPVTLCMAIARALGVSTISTAMAAAVSSKSLIRMSITTCWMVRLMMVSRASF